MEITQIEAFLVLAEELHFGRASQRLHVSQSMVSRRIAALEASLGGKLFERTSRQVRLTALGTDLEQQIRPAYTSLRAALDTARAAARGTSGSLAIGVTISTNRPSLARLVDAFERHHPDCEVRIVEVDHWAPYGPLRSGHVDVLCNWAAVTEPDLTVGPAIEECQRVAVVGKAHRLASRSSVSIEDLAGEPVNQPPRRYPAALADAILVPATRTGKAIPRTQAEIDSPAHVAALIARGEIISLAAQGTSFYSRSDIVQVPITDLPPLSLALIWSASRENGRIRALARDARSLGPVNAAAPRRRRS
jgi:DNA-binding transcriptional LysR family regulator